MINLVKNKIAKTSHFIKIIAGILLVSSCAYWHEVSIKYIVPEGYEGMVMIAWNQPNGAMQVKDGDFEVYKIPSNGFLKSKAKARNLTILEEQFYSYNKETGKETKLEAIDPSITTDTIIKRNQFYKIGLLSGGYGGTNNMIFFITRDKKSRFMDYTYRQKYLATHEDMLYKTVN